CFDCGGDFRLEASESNPTFPEEILSGNLSCENCGKTYPIIRGIPRFVSKSLSENVARTSHNFGQEWTMFDRLSEGQCRQLVDWLSPLPPDFFRDKLVVDLGCGMGRNPLYFAEHGAKTVVGVDISEAVDVAYRNCRDFQNIHVIQADIYHLPLKPI